MRPIVAGLIALGLSWTVEFAQLTSVPTTLSGIHPLLRLVFGSTFSPADLPAYAVGAILGVAVHHALHHTRTNW